MVVTPNVNALFALGAPKPAKPVNLGTEEDTWYVLDYETLHLQSDTHLGYRIAIGLSRTSHNGTLWKASNPMFRGQTSCFASR